MAYAVEIGFLDLAGIFNPAVRGGIWVPPPPDGSSPGGPNFAGTVTSGSGQAPLTLTFAELAGPPAGGSAMLVTEPAGGDLFRSGQVALPGASPASLALTIAPGQEPGNVAMTPAQLNTLAASFAGTSIKVPDNVRLAAGVLSAGLLIPESVTLLTAALSLGPGAISVTLTANISVREWFFFVAHYSCALTMSLAVGPSGDPVDTSRVLAATVSASPGPVLTVPGAPGIYASLVAGWAAAAVSAMLEAQANKAISPLAAAELAKHHFELTPTAVISAVRVVTTVTGISLFVSVGDIFGPGIVPLTQTQVPNVVGDEPAAAATALTAAGLAIRITQTVTSATVATPTVVSQTPPPGAEVQAGTYVDVVVEAPRPGPPP